MPTGRINQGGGGRRGNGFAQGARETRRRGARRRSPPWRGWAGGPVGRARRPPPAVKRRGARPSGPEAPAARLPRIPPPERGTAGRRRGRTLEVSHRFSLCPYWSVCLLAGPRGCGWGEARRMDPSHAGVSGSHRRHALHRTTADRLRPPPRGGDGGPPPRGGSAPGGGRRRRRRRGLDRAETKARGARPRRRTGARPLGKPGVASVRSRAGAGLLLSRRREVREVTDRAPDQEVRRSHEDLQRPACETRRVRDRRGVRPGLWLRRPRERTPRGSRHPTVKACRDFTQGDLTRGLPLVYRAVNLPRAGPGVTPLAAPVTPLGEGSMPRDDSPLTWPSPRVRRRETRSCRPDPGAGGGGSAAGGPVVVAAAAAPPERCKPRARRMRASAGRARRLAGADATRKTAVPTRGRVWPG